MGLYMGGPAAGVVLQAFIQPPFHALIWVKGRSRLRVVLGAQARSLAPTLWWDMMIFRTALIVRNNHRCFHSVMGRHQRFRQHRIQAMMLRSERVLSKMVTDDLMRVDARLRPMDTTQMGRRSATAGTPWRSSSLDTRPTARPSLFT